MARRLDYYSVSPEAEARLPTLIADDCIPQGIRDYVSNLVACYQANSRNPISRSQLQDFLKALGKGSAPSYMSLRQRDLEVHGALEETHEIYLAKNIRLLTVKDFKKLIAHYHSPIAQSRTITRKATRNQIQNDLRDAEQQGEFLPTKDDLQGRMEGLFTGILDAAVRLSGKDSRTLLECDYIFGDNDRIHITTKTLSNSEITILSDQRVIRALNTAFIDYVELTYGPLAELTDEKRQAIDGLFFFDLFDLCERIDLDPSPRNREIVRKILGRLRDTAFEIEASGSKYFREKYARGADSIQYRYITEFYAKKQDELFDEDAGIYRHAERFYFIKFHSVLLDQLLTKGHSYIADPALTKERRGIAHRLSNWCKAKVGVRQKPGSNVYTFLMDDFWGAVMQSSRLDNFCRDMMSLLQQNRIDGDETLCAEGEGEGRFVSRVYGYLFEVSTDREDIEDIMRRKQKRFRRGGKHYPVLRIWRDPTDAYVGDDSAHNQALRRMQLQLEAAR